MNFTGEDKLVKAKIDLNYTNPFFSYILMNMIMNEVKNSAILPTMGINKMGNLYWNKNFVDGISLPELTAVLAHEVGHIITDTFGREGCRDKKLWNIATDIAINYLLVQEGFKLPESFVINKKKSKAFVPDAKGDIELKFAKGNIKINVSAMTADEIYDILTKNAEASNSAGDGGMGDGSYDGQMDSHLPTDCDGNGQEQGTATDASMKANSEEWKKKLVEAYTHAKMRGTVSANVERLIEGILFPKINWRHKLYSFITNDIPIDYTMRYPSKKFYSTGVYSPSVVRESLNIIIGCDASGSISYGSAESEGHQFLSEVLGIVTSFTQVKSRLIFWDAQEIHQGNDVEITTGNKNAILKRTYKGGGGTEMSIFARHCKKRNYRSNLYVIMTDGFIEDKPELPKGKILFVLSKNGDDKIIKKYGEVCRL